MLKRIEARHVAITKQIDSPHQEGYNNNNNVFQIRAQEQLYRTSVQYEGSIMVDSRRY